MESKQHSGNHTYPLTGVPCKVDRERLQRQKEKMTVNTIVTEHLYTIGLDMENGHIVLTPRWENVNYGPASQIHTGRRASWRFPNVSEMRAFLKKNPQFPRITG